MDNTIDAVLSSFVDELNRDPGQDRDRLVDQFAEKLPTDQRNEFRRLARNAIEVKGLFASGAIT